MEEKPSSSSGTTRTSSEARRNQVRQAQKAYHARKKEALQTLENRVQFLERTVEEMSKAMIELNDILVSSPAFRRQPELVRRLETSLRHTLSLASEVHPSDDSEEQASSRPAVSLPLSDTTGTLTSTELTTTEPQGRNRQYSLPDFDPLLSVQNSPINTNIGMSQLTEGGIVLSNPMASRLFPFFADWSTFALRLYWNTLILAYTALDEVDTSTLRPELFRYTLEHRPKDKILQGLRNMLNYMAVTPARADGSVIVTPRPFNYDGSGQLGDEDEAKHLLEQFLAGCDGLQTAIASNIAVGPEQGQRFLFANEVQSYMEERGCQVRQDSVVELPTAASIQISEQRAAQTSQPAPPDRQSRSEALPGSQSFNPLSWHDSSVIFPQDDAARTSPQDASGTEHSAGSATQRDLTPQTHLISMDELIQHFSRISVCVGAGARYPSRGIDATINALAMNRLVC